MAFDVERVQTFGNVHLPNFAELSHHVRRTRSDPLIKNFNTAAGLACIIYSAIEKSMNSDVVLILAERHAMSVLQIQD